MTNSSVSSGTPQSAPQKSTLAVNEPDLMELWRALWDRKWLVAGVTALVTLMTLVFALLATPVYKVSVALLPPGLGSFDEILNVYQNVYQQESFNGFRRIFYFSDEQDFYKDAFELLLTNLNSSRLRQQFEKQHGDLSASLIKVDKPKLKKGEAHITVSVQSNDREKLQNWLNQYINFIRQETISNLVQRAESYIATQVSSLNKQKEVIKSLYIQQLRNNFIIAKRLGIEDVHSNAAVGPLYLRGTKALSQEIDYYKSSEATPFHLDNILDLESNLRVFSGMDVDPKRVSVYQEGSATLDPSVVKPNRKLIVALGVALGLMLGCVAVIIAHLLAQKKASHNV